jgi:hypothetical protein
LKIQHALKETSYLTDGAIFAISAAKATTIGNFFGAAPHQTEQDCATNCKAKAIKAKRPQRKHVPLPPGVKSAVKAKRAGGCHFVATVLALFLLWHIYDVRSNFVQRLSGHTLDGKIEAKWFMKDAKGVMRTNDDLDPEFSSVVTVENRTNKWTKAQK